ncbi:tetratricopeptide repeat protein [Planctomycetes bacterium K23_9]|uniref:Cellulose synthase subunit BcsC n=1 Tax=Stieleria marina TaxID=1930275 RepID=A0A517NPB9_9BACT|nr:cellulose synthase subunit BcsC [Planctomycetes bacterium K23_9]
MVTSRFSSVLTLALLVILISQLGCRAISRIGESRQSIAARRMSRQGLQAMHNGDWTNAENLFSDALELSSSDDRAHRGLAESFWQREQPEPAIKHMENAVRLSGNDPKLVQRLGRMYFDVGRVEEANQQSLVALEADRYSAEVWALRGDCLRSQSNNVQALAAYHRALALQPDFPDVQMQAAEIYRVQGRYDRLLATLDRLQEGLGGIEIPPRVDMLRGIAMRQLGQHDEARRCFASAATRDPSNAEAHLQIAALCLDAGDIQSARESVDVAMKIDPIAVRDGRWIEQLENQPQHVAGHIQPASSITEIQRR